MSVLCSCVGYELVVIPISFYFAGTVVISVALYDSQGVLKLVEVNFQVNACENLFSISKSHF